MEQVSLKLNVCGYFCNTWPNLKITHNGDIQYNSEIMNDVDITLTLDSLKENTIHFSLTNKSLGENGVWDTEVDESNNIIHDKFIKFNNITLNKVDAMPLLHKSSYLNESSLETSTNHNGYMNFNGSIEFHYETPLLNFLIDAKFKKKIDTSRSYFSNDTYMHHYDLERELILEIRELLSNIDE